MIDSEIHPRPEFGPPVLLKRLGNAVEANLARARLESAGIPSFLGEQDVFSGGAIHAGGHTGVEIYVPADLLDDALDVLEAPPDLPDPSFFEPFVEDPGRRLSFKALVTSVIGWLVVVLHPVGAFLSLGLHLYAIYLAGLGVLRSQDRDLTLRVRVVATAFLSVAGIAMTLFLLADLFRRY